MNDINLTAGQLSAARRTYTGTEANAGPNVMQTEVAAMAVELRAQGVYESDRTIRPGRLMRRKVTDWEEIPHDVTPDDIVPGYSERKAAREVAG